MKGFLIFVCLLALIAGGFYGGYLMLGRDRTEEVRMIGALKLAQQEISKEAEGVETLIFSPKFEAVPQSPDSWALSGIATTTKETGERAEGAFSALVVNTCAQYNNPACWSLSDLEIKQKIRPAKSKGGVEEASQEEVAEDTAPDSETDASTEIEPEEVAAASADEETPQTSAPETSEVEDVAESSAGAEPAETADNAQTTQPEPSLETLAAATAQSPEPVPQVESPPEPDFSTLSRDELVRQVQQSLTRLGYDPGPADGKIGPRTIAAIQAFQSDQGMPADGQATATLLGEITKVVAN